jgi:hypothetical protein
MNRFLTAAAVAAVICLSAVAAEAGPLSATSVTRTTPPSRSVMPLSAPAENSRHYISNLDGSRAPFGLGFNLADTSPRRYAVNALPRGVKAVVWWGQDCPTRPNAEFRNDVRRLAANKRVFAWYLADEPHIADCPYGPAALEERIAFIHRVTAGRQLTFVVLEDPRDMRAFGPRKTGVDLVGLDPYPCSVAHPHCRVAEIHEGVRAAVDAGISKTDIVPVYQAFGQENTSDTYYLLPAADRMKAMLAAWKRHVPNPIMDYTYGWGHQGSSNPTLVDSPRLQRVLTNFFAAN